MFVWLAFFWGGMVFLFVCLFGFFFFLVSLVDWKLINIRIREKFNKFAQKQYAIAKNVYEYESDESVTLTIFEKVRNKMVYMYIYMHDYNYYSFKSVLK